MLFISPIPQPCGYYERSENIIMQFKINKPVYKNKQCPLAKTMKDCIGISCALFCFYDRNEEQGTYKGECAIKEIVKVLAR